MRKILEEKGWKMYHECRSCGHKLYFNHPEKPGYEIRAKVNNRTFSIIQNNQIVSGPHWGYQLEDKLAAAGL